MRTSAKSTSSIFLLLITTFCPLRANAEGKCVDLFTDSTLAGLTVEMRRSENIADLASGIIRGVQDGNGKFYSEMGLAVDDIIRAASIKDRGSRDALVQASLPSLSEWVANIRKMQEASLAAWNLKHPDRPIKLEETIQPGIPYYNKSTKQYLTLEVGAKAPPGFEPFELAVGRKLLPGRGLYSAISGGRFPLLAFFFRHDFLGHFASYIKHPDYAVAYRAVAKEVIDRGGWGKLSKNQRTKVFIFNEDLMLIDKSKILPHKSKFHFPSESTGIMPVVGEMGYSFDHVYPIVAKLSVNELKATAKFMLKLASKSYIPIGGDASTPGRYKYFEGGPLRWFVRAQPSEIRPMDIENIKFELAKLESSLGLLSEISVEDWKGLIFSDTPTPLTEALTRVRLWR